MLWGGPPAKWIYLYKRLCIYSTSSSKYSLFDAIHLSRRFSHCSEQFLNSSVLMPFSASPIFCFTSSMSPKCFPLRNFFIWGNKRKSRVGWDQVNGEGEVQGSHCFFGRKLLHTQHSVGRCAHKSSPITKWANTVKESLKKTHQSWTQPLTTTPGGPLMQMGS